MPNYVCNNYRGQRRKGILERKGVIREKYGTAENKRKKSTEYKLRNRETRTNP